LTNEGRSIAASNNFADGTNSTIVTVNNPPATTANLSTCSSPFSAFNCYVEVLISQPQTPQLLSLFMSTGPTIQARAVALANISAADTGILCHKDCVERDRRPEGTGELFQNSERFVESYSIKIN